MKWIHLSDIHFADFGFSVEKLRGALIKKLKSLSPEFDFILITGDVFYRNESGKDVIPNLKKFILDIAKACHVDKSGIYLCAGNHDFNRADVKRNALIDKARSESMLSTDTYNDLTGIGNDGFRSLYREIRKKEYADYEVLDVKKSDVRVISINSCLLSKDDDDYHNLRVCTTILEKIGDDIKEDGKLNLLIMHHGVDWLNPVDARSFEHWVEDSRIDALFVGHTHQPKVVGLNDVNRDIYQFTSGALMQDGHAVPSFFICEEDEGILTISLYSYSDKTDSWDLDNHNLRKFRNNGRHTFYLPQRVASQPLYEDSLSDLTCDEIINTLNEKYETKYGSKRFVSDKTKEHEDFNAWKIFGSLVNVGVYYPVALRLCVNVVETVTSDEYPSDDLLHSGTIKSVISNHLKNAHKLFPEINEYEIGIWTSVYDRHYEKERGFVLFDGRKEEPISYNLLKTDIIREVVIQLTGNEVYYKKITTSELEKMASEIMKFIKSLGISRIDREALLIIIKEYVSEPPHPWFVNSNRDELLEYHKKNADRQLSELADNKYSNPILQIEAAYHLFAAFLTIYDDYIGCTETSPITILKNSIDQISTKANDHLPMRRCLLIQLKDDLKEKGINFAEFKQYVDIVFTNIVERRKVTIAETTEALMKLREMLSLIDQRKEEEWKDTGNTIEDIRILFKEARGFIVKEPLQQFKRKAFFFLPYWDELQIEQFGLGDDILVMVAEDETLDILCRYLIQERKKRVVKDVVFFHMNAESFSPNERKDIRDLLKKHEINVRCIFIQRPDFVNINANGWRKEFFKVVGKSRKSIY